MNNLKAPSDRIYELIDCKVCNIKLQNETTYKIHLTTPQHLKKEDSLVACGKIPKLPRVTKWENLNEYLDYLRLDEPFIGLQHVIEVDPLKYLCRLCFYEADMPSIALHLVGRKHRQKYLETSRPDLVVWDVNTPSQLGKTIKAQAEVVERQEGRGVIECHAEEACLKRTRFALVLPLATLTKKKNIAPVDQKGKGFLKAWQGKIRKSRWDTPEDHLSEPVGNFLDQLKALTGNVSSSNPASRTEFSRDGGYPEDDLRGRYPDNNLRGRYPEDDLRGRYPEDDLRGRYPEDDLRGRYPEDDLRGRYPKDDLRGRYPDDNLRGRYPDDNLRGRYPDDNLRGRYPEDDLRGRFPDDDLRGRYPDDDLRGRYPDDDLRGSYAKEDLRGSYGKEDLRGSYGKEDLRGSYAKEDLRGSYGKEDLRGSYGKEDLRGSYGKEDLRGSYGKEDLRGRLPSGDDLGRRFLKDGFSGDSPGKRQLEDDQDRRRIPEGGLGRNKIFENLPGLKIRDYDSGRKLYDDDSQGRIPHNVPERQLVEGDGERRLSAGGWGRPLTQSGAGERLFEGDVGGRKLPAGYHADKMASRLHGDRPRGGYPENSPAAGFPEGGAGGRFPEGGLSRRPNADSLVRSYPEDPSAAAFPADGRSERTDFETFSNKRLRMDPMVPKQDEYLQDGYSRAQTAVVNPGDFLNSMGSIEMQSPEEATFLREKLCDILKEFQAKKAQGETVKPGVPQPTIFKDYNHMKVDPGMPSRDGYQVGGGDFGSDSKSAGRRSSDRSLYPLPAERWPSDRSQYPLSSYGQDPPNAGRFSDDGPVYQPPSSRGAFSFPGASSAYQSPSGDKAGYATQRERLNEAPPLSFNRGGPADRGASTSSDKLTATLLQVFSRGFK